MIPEYKVGLWKMVYPEKIRWPSEKVLSFEDGLLVNHDYIDQRGLPWNGFGGFLNAYKLERKIITRVGKQSRNAFQFDNLLDQVVDEEAVDDLWGFDPGVASATLAISAFGGAPVSSCRHHPRRSGEAQPYVAFWVKRDDVRRIAEATRKLRIGLSNYDLEGFGGMMAWGRSVLDMMEFGKVLYEFDTGKSLK